MAAPLKDFARIVRLLLKGLKYASLAVIAVTAVVITREVVGAFQFFHDIHPVLGWAFLLVFSAALFWFVGRPAYRYWKVPLALRQPRLPKDAELDLPLVGKRIDFVLRYLGGLRRNPRMDGQGAALDGAEAAARELRGRLDGGAFPDARSAQEELHRFEREYMDRLLRPLDDEANRVIRQEALAVGIGTAVSMNGTVDAFVVLWRNANLVARVATIYYGRPGVRGSLMILRDVAAGMLVAHQIQGVVESMGGLLGGWFGKAGSLLVGPAGDGAVNALATVRIGYVAKARCRAYRPWNDATVPDILRQTLKEVANQGAAVARDVVSTVVKGGLVKVPAELARKAGGLLAGLFGREKPEPSAGTP